MAVSPTTLATQLGIQSFTRRPVWGVQTTEIESYPTGDTSGVWLRDSPATLIQVDLREEVHHRRATLAFPTPVIGDVFTVTIDGSAVAYDSAGASSLDEMVVGLAAAINADPVVSLVVSAVAVLLADETTVVGTRDGVRLEGLDVAAYSIDFTRAGTSVIVAQADAEEATAIPFWKTRGREGWRSREVFVLNHRGFLDRYPTGGIERGHIALVGLVGHASDGPDVTLRDPLISFGPADEEAT